MTRHKIDSSLRPRILGLWRQDPARFLSLRDVLDELQLPRPLQRQLGELLDSLVEEGALRTHQRRYGLPGDAKRTRDKREGGSREDRSGAETGTGTYSAHRRGFGFVDLDGPRRSVFVPPGRAGGALDGDRVRVTIRRERGGTREAGEVIEVLTRFRERVRGHLSVSRREVWLEPINEELPAVFMGETAPPNVRNGDLVEARITQFPIDDEEAPAGELIGPIADDESHETIIGHILADHQWIEDFSPQAVKDAEHAAKQPISPRGREDLRDLPFVTIDGEDARDFDDAVCLIPLPGGRQRLLVAIADVAFYVRPGTALDQEAYRKGTSVYLPHRALPMLPEVLSTDLCSLRPREPRYSMTCDMELSAEGDPLGYRIYDSLIFSRARLTYTQVQEFFDTERAETLPDPGLAPMLAQMRAFAAVLRARRKARGALTLNLPEARFQLDAQGLPVSMRQVWPTEATQLIEQFMLEANEQVARHAFEHELPVLYRVHDPPPSDSLDTLQVLLHNAGVTTQREELSNGIGLNRVLLQLETHPLRAQLEIAILRSMMQAQYRASNDGHFGLASECYTHFTSPIRRYPDLLLHRALKETWTAQAGHKAKAAPRLPSDAGPHLSLTERIAADIEQQVQRLFKVLMMESHLGEEFAGKIVNLGEPGMWVELVGWGVDALLPTDALPGSGYRFDRERNALRTEHARKGQPREITPGAQLTVQLARADRRTQTLELAFVEWSALPEPAPERQRDKTERPRKPSTRGKAAPGRSRKR